MTVPSPYARAAFDAALHSNFDVRADDGTAPVLLRLTEVRARRAPPGYEQFSALFVGPTAPALPQANYRFRHATLGELPLFIVPIGQDAGGVTYEACISRLTGGDGDGDDGG